MVGRSRISADSEPSPPGRAPSSRPSPPGRRHWTERRPVAGRARHRREPERDVGALPLRPDERRGIRLPALQLGQHRAGGVPALGAVPADLPLPPDLLGRVQVDGDVEAGAGQLGVQREQAFHDHELARLDEHRAAQLAGGVVVDGLEYGPAERQELQVLLHHLDVVAVRVQHGERHVLALRPVVAVVVVHAQRGCPVRAQGLGDAPGQGGLTRGAVAGDREHHRAPWLWLVMTPQPHELVRHGRGPRLRPARSDAVNRHGKQARRAGTSPARGVRRGKCGSGKLLADGTGAAGYPGCVPPLPLSVLP